MIVVRRSADRWWRFDVTVRDAPLALVLLLPSLVPALQNNGTRLGDVPDRPLDALGIAVVAVECLPLIVRRRLPAACLALVSTGFALDQLHGYHTVAGTALPIALISAGPFHLHQHDRPDVAPGISAQLLRLLIEHS